ncbi:MAG: phage portal protein [Promethearchaeota archaeon]
MDENKLTKIINNWLNSDKYKMMLNGEKYYMTQNKILNRAFYYWTRNEKKPDTYRANVKIANNFFKVILDQKVSYLLGKDITINEFTPSFDINEEIYYTAESASQCSVGWLFIYIDKNSMLKQKTIPSETIIRINDNTIEENTTGIIRLYSLFNDDDIEEFYCELWEDNKYTIYKKDGGIYKFQEEKTHLNNGVSWGRIPFIRLDNNRYGYSDLCPIKSLVDAYDIIISDFANNFVDFQEVILMIKNYAENVKTEEAAAEFMEWLKKHKVISVKDNGDVEIINKEIPYQARIEFLQLLRKLIFLFSQAVDIDDLTGSNLTNVNIESRFASLDQKAEKFKKELLKFVRTMLEFSNLYNQLINTAKGIQDVFSAEIIFNKSQLINEHEKIEDCVTQVGTGVASHRTIVANNPIVNDVEAELKEIEKDELNSNNNNYDGNADNDFE